MIDVAVVHGPWRCSAAWTPCIHGGICFFELCVARCVWQKAVRCGWVRENKIEERKK